MYIPKHIGAGDSKWVSDCPILLLIKSANIIGSDTLLMVLTVSGIELCLGETMVHRVT